MRGADIAVARYYFIIIIIIIEFSFTLFCRKLNGQYILEDRFVPGTEGEPKIDDHQDLKLISATSDDTSLTVLFTRKLIPCDHAEDVAIQDHV